MLTPIPEQTIAIYCFLNNLLTQTSPIWARPADQRRRWLDAGVLTMFLMGLAIPGVIWP